MKGAGESGTGVPARGLRGSGILVGLSIDADVGFGTVFSLGLGERTEEKEETSLEWGIAAGDEDDDANESSPMLRIRVRRGAGAINGARCANFDETGVKTIDASESPS